MPTGGLQATPLRLIGVALGGLALLAALLLPAQLAGVPLGPAIANLALLAGLLALLLLLFAHRDQAFGDRLLVVVAPALATGVLVRLLLMDPGANQAVVLRETGVPEVVSVALTLLLVWGLEARLQGPRATSNAFTVVGRLATVSMLVVVALHIERLWPVPRGPAIVLGLTLTLVATALVVQRALAHRSERRELAALAHGPALVVAGAHLLDGVVSYLGVRDPLGLLDGSLHEGVFLSELILTHGGPLFPVAKWALACGVVGIMARSEVSQAATGPWWQRFSILLLVLFLGLGPGLFSSLRVLSI